MNIARRAERDGADALLLLPQYLIGAERDGLFAHIRQVCDAVGIGVIVYARDNCILTPATLARLAETCPNLIGFKDDHGDVELLTRICVTLGDRFTDISGMPTAEVYAKAYLAAVFIFLPAQALEFHKALLGGDVARVDDLLKRFYYPLVDLRNRKRGYPVSIVKAGLRVLGRDMGPVRATLTDLTADEHAELGRIIESAFGHVEAA